jgi:pimeloyl-ACP methyl ester carboxylesterase
MARESLQTVKFPGIGGVQLAADVKGDPADPAVLLFHGGGQTRHSWHTTTVALGQSGWRACSFDLRGHGESDWAPDGDYGVDAFKDDVVSVASAVSEIGPVRPALVGASLGGVSALLALGETGSETARALVLVDIGHRIEASGAARIGQFMWENMEKGFATVEDAAAAVAAYNPHRPPPSDLSGLKRNLRRREDGRWVWHWDPRFIQQPQGDLDETRISLVPQERLEAAARNLRVPGLLVRGRMSDELSEEGAQQFLALVPHAEYVDVAGAGHMVAGDRNDVFNDAIVTFLSTVR